MKKIFFISFFLVLLNCTSHKNVYWCGDHPCINKKEKEAYFKKTMIVEVRKLENDNNTNKSQINKITEKVKVDEKKRIKEEKNLLKQAKLEEKKRIKEEKNLLKQAKLEEKKRIKEEKELSKAIKLKEKKNTKKINNVSEKRIEISAVAGNMSIEVNKFRNLVEKIINKNSSRPYPDINDIPN